MYEIDNSVDFDDNAPGDTDRLFGEGLTDTLFADIGDGLDTVDGGPSTGDRCVSDDGDREIACETK